MTRDLNRFHNAMRQASTQADAHIQAGTTPGVVTSFDPVTQSAKVRLQPHDLETGYLPIRTAWAGPGWGLFTPPPVGSVVDVQFEDGDLETGAIVGRAHNDVDKPLPVPAGELWAVHASGLRMCLTNDGRALLGGKPGAATVILGNPADLHTLVKDTFEALYNAHTHTDSRGGTTSGPNQPMTAAHLTIETEAS